MDSSVEINKKEFCELLRATNREGVEDVIEDLEQLGFFSAPASCNNHLNYEGGLVVHSLNVYRIAISLRKQMIEIDPSVQNEVPEDHVAIASLLHDVCKADIYVRTAKKQKTPIGTWEETIGWKCNYKNFPMGHGEKSVIMLMCDGLEMYEDEMLAIRWHMGAWDLPMQSSEMTKSIDVARKKHVLCVLIQCADTLAASILERTGSELDNY